MVIYNAKWVIYLLLRDEAFFSKWQKTMEINPFLRSSHIDFMLWIVNLQEKVYHCCTQINGIIVQGCKFEAALNKLQYG